MSDASLGPRTGSALVWKAAELVGGRGINLVRTLILARLLAPDAFGLLAIGTLTIEVLLAVTEFGLVQALVQRDEPLERHYDAAWTLRLLRAVALSAVVAGAAPLIAAGFSDERAAPIVAVLGLRPLLDALASIRLADLTRTLRFKSVTAVAVGTSVIDAVIAITLAPTIGVWAVVAASLAATGTASAASYVIAPYRPRISFDWSASKPLFRFGRWLLLSGVVGVVGGLVLQAVVSRRLGADDLGVYSLGNRLATLPNGVVSTIVVAVAFSLHARIQHDPSRSARAFRTSLVGMLAVLAPAYALFIAMAPSFAASVLGPDWAGIVGVLRLLCVAAIIGTIADATMPMLEGQGRPELVTVLYAVRSVVVVALIWQLSNYGVTGAALAWLAAEVGVQALCVQFARRSLDRPFAGLWRPLSAVAVAAAAAAGIGWTAVAALPGVADIVVGGIAGMAVAAAVLLAADRVAHLGLVRDLQTLYPQAARRLPLLGTSAAPPGQPEPPVADAAVPPAGDPRRPQ